MPGRVASPGRRRVLQGTAAASAWLLLGGHAPYGQWGVYRERFLLILTTRADPASFELGKRLAEVLARELPESRARVSRAPHKARVASLISTKQLDVALMRPDDAMALRTGAAPYEDYGPVALRTMARVGDFLLVCRADFAARHAWLIAKALREAETALPGGVRPVGTPDGAPPLHEGARAYADGAPMPAATPDDHTHGHGHE